MSDTERVPHRPVMGCLGGIFALLIGVFAFTWLGNSVGVASSIELDEPITITHGSGSQSWDEETDTLMTWYGQMTTYLSLVLSIWVGFAVSVRRFNAGWDREGWTTFVAWAGGLLVLSFVSLASELLLPRGGGRWVLVLRNLLLLGVTIGVAWLCYCWWEKRVAALKSSSSVTKAD